MLQLIFHGIGDYFFQTDHQALNKKKKGKEGLWCCLKHCFTYSLLFFFIGSPLAVAVVFITHFIVDRSNLVAYIIAFKNQTIYPGHKDFPNSKKYNIENFGFDPARPFAISIWLYIICDNLLHIICNYLAIKYL